MTDIRAALDKFRSNSKLFSQMDDAGLDKLASIAVEVSFQPNDTIVRQGAAANTFYIIVKGGVRVISEGGEEGHEVARLGAGQFFGEMGILNDEPRTANVRAIGDTHCFAFEKDALLQILQDYPKILHGLGAVGVERAAKLEETQE